MGVKNLWDILESCKKIHPLHHLQNKRVCIDLSCWIVQLHSVNKSHCSMNYKLYLRGLFHRLRALIALNCSLIFVTDGSIPAIKLSCYRRRLKSVNEMVTQDESKLEKVSSLRRNMGSEFSCMIKEAKSLGLALGIPCLDGIEEAEAQCALLNSETLCDGCFTSDSDAFLFGARTVYRDICLGEGGHVICYEMTDIESTLGFGRNSLIALALLLGSDYSQGVHGIGQDKACQIVREVGDDIILQRVASEGLSIAKMSKGAKKGRLVPKGANIENYSEQEKRTSVNDSDSKFLQVIDAYLKPKCHKADSDAVRRSLALYPLQQTKLQLLCAEFFDWPHEKTDEYILPKIAERDLRRFANLRKTSSDVGLRLPLHEMPVKCPISKIIKHRKIQGKDCFEVSWEALDGLESSIVPADLVECACSEKIVEFEERKAQGKKQNQRKPRKNKTCSSTAELDKKLEHLLLDIELGSTAASSSCSLTSTKYGNPTLHTSISKSPFLDKVSKNCITFTEGSSSSISSRDVKEVIDLLSPCPANISKKREEGSNVIIDISDSETESSPEEHRKKARELRLFIASIKNDINT